MSAKCNLCRQGVERIKDRSGRYYHHGSNGSVDCNEPPLAIDARRHLYLHSACHPTEPVRIKLDGIGLIVECAECGHEFVRLVMQSQ